MMVLSAAVVFQHMFSIGYYNRECNTIPAKNYQTTLKIALKPPSPITMLDRLDSTAHIILLIKSQHFSLNLNIKFGGKGGNTAGLDIFWPRL